MPVWAEADPREYWDAADRNERANGRLFVDGDFALPRGLGVEDQVDLARILIKDPTDWSSDVRDTEPQKIARQGLLRGCIKLFDELCFHVNIEAESVPARNDRGLENWFELGFSESQIGTRLGFDLLVLKEHGERGLREGRTAPQWPPEVDLTKTHDSRERVRAEGTA